MPAVLVRCADCRCASGIPEQVSAHRLKPRVSYSAIPPVGSLRDPLTQDRTTCLVSISIAFLSFSLLDVSALLQYYSLRAEVLYNLLSSCRVHSIKKSLDD